MSRVSDAMRRAGRDDEHQSGARPDDTAFVPGEDGVVEPAADNEASGYDASDAKALPHIEAEAVTPVSLELVPQRFATTIPVAVARNEPGDDVRLLEILRTLYRRKWVIVGVVAVCVVIAETYNRMAIPMFEAQARVLVRPTAPEVATFRSSSEDPGRLDYFVTQLEVLRSRGLARKALIKMNQLSPDPARQSGQINQFIGSLLVRPSTSPQGDSRVVNIAYKSTDPQLAAQRANGLARAYVDENLEGMRKASREASAWLSERLAELKREVSNSEGALQQYREHQDAVSLDEGQNVDIQSFLQLSTQALTASAERVAKEAAFQQLEEIRTSGAPLDTYPTIQASPTIAQHKADLAALHQQRQKLSETQLDGNPEMIAVKNAIDNKQALLNAETNKLADSIRREYMTARATEQGIIKSLNAQKNKVVELNRKAIQYGALERNAASSQQIVESVLLKLKETEISGSLHTNNIEVLDEAEVPGSAIWPRKQLNLALAVLGGGFLALGLIFAMEHTHPRLAEPEDIAGALGLPLLGVAPQVAALSDRAATLEALPHSFQEAIRGIRTRIMLSATSSGVRTLAITSARPGEGKTVVSSTLAISMAMAGRRVLLIDADLRRAQLRHVFNIPRAPGLSNIVMGEIKPSQALVESSVKGLFILPAGSEMPNPGDLLDSERLNQLIQGLKHVFDVVVIDCPPVMAVADASIVANAASSVVFVVGSGITSPDEARLAVGRLAAVQAKIVGVVLNKAKVSSRSEYYYPYPAETSA